MNIIIIVIIHANIGLLSADAAPPRGNCPEMHQTLYTFSDLMTVFDG
jgi:hypothetical protein